MGRLHPEVRPLNYPFIYRFWQKSSPFRIPSIDKWYPFHTPSIELCIPFNNCTCIVFNISWINHKTRTFSQLFHCIKMHLLALLSLFTDKMAYFPTHSYTSTSEIPKISFTWRLKKVPVWGGASPYRPLKGVTSPPRGGGVGTQLQGSQVQMKMMSHLTITQSRSERVKFKET